MKKESKIIIVLIFIMLLIIIAGGGYFLIKNIRESNKKIEELEKKVVNIEEMNNFNNTDEKKQYEEETDKDIVSISSANKAFTGTSAFENKVYVGYSADKKTMYKVTFDENCNFSIYLEDIEKQAISTYRSENFENLKMVGHMNDTTLIFDYKYQNGTQFKGKGKIFYSENSWSQSGYNEIELSLSSEPNVENVILKLM